LNDLVYPFLEYNDKSIGMIVETYNNRNSVYNVLVKGKVYVVPKHKLVLAQSVTNEKR
tara:strand:+ start:812 stop:985 length:174 start_codon:yes stop_codon:yes gene_type:complete